MKIFTEFSRKVFGKKFSKIRIPVDPAGDCCYESSTKPCKSEGLYDTGRMLSNTSIICPTVWDSHGKLWVKPDR